MNSPTFIEIPSWYLFTLLAILLPAIVRYISRPRKARAFFAPAEIAQTVFPRDEKGSRIASQVKWYQKLYFQLQNIEDHPEILIPARDELLSLFSRSLQLANQSPQRSIFRIEQYDSNEIWKFIRSEQSEVLAAWKSYLGRRKRGCAPELFATFEAAKAWLIKQAPVKFVDGAWLAHTHKITTPFAFRSITKNAWQVLSEELGDGDLSKHHVYLYRQLLNDIGHPLPDGQSEDFIESIHRAGEENPDVWEAAVGQLLISLFPNEFLPEILGFNMHYELITLDTMRAAHELKSLGLDPYYFLIHLSIDNADSGHTAMATHTVTRYLDKVQAIEGDKALKMAWRRVQVGYNLSQTFGSSLRTADIEPCDMLASPSSARVIEIFKAKIPVSHDFHCQSRVRIGGQTLEEWMAPELWTDPNSSQQEELLRALSQAKPWIYPGESKKSLLIREVSWRGRMFGAFTHDEVVALTTWIDELGTRRSLSLYWNFTHREPLASKDAVGELQSPICHHPVVKHLNIPNSNLGSRELGFDDPKLWVVLQPLTLSIRARFPDVIALWFSHIGLLENTINTPCRTATPMYASIIRCLRAQAGFALETSNVAGMDEMRRLSTPGLVEIGLEMICRAGWAADTKVTCLRDIVFLTASKGQCQKSVKLAHDMMCWRTQPYVNFGWLLGMAFAFLELKNAVARTSGLLSPETCVVVDAIVVREKQSLLECVSELQKASDEQYEKLIRGFQHGRGSLEDCLREC